MHANAAAQLAATIDETTQRMRSAAAHAARARARELARKGKVIPATGCPTGQVTREIAKATTDAGLVDVMIFHARFLNERKTTPTEAEAERWIEARQAAWMINERKARSAKVVRSALLAAKHRLMQVHDHALLAGDATTLDLLVRQLQAAADGESW